MLFCWVCGQCFTGRVFVISMRGIDEFQLGGIVLQLLWEIVVRWTWRSNNEVVMSTDTDENLDDFVVIYPVCPTTTTGALLRRFRRDYCRNVAEAPPVQRFTGKFPDVSVRCPVLAPRAMTSSDPG